MADDESGGSENPSSREPRAREAAAPAPVPTATGPTAQDIAASLLALQKPAEGQFQKLEIWALLLTGVMAIATIISVVVSRDQWKQLRLQNKMISEGQASSNTSSKRITRAYITFSSVEISRYSNDKDRVTLTLRNVGQTPAYIDAMRMGLSYYRRGDLTAAVRGIRLRDGNLFGYPVGAGEPFKRVVEFDVDPDLRKAYSRGTDVERLAVFIVHYKDIYGDRRSYISCPFRNRDWDRMAHGPRVVNCQQFFPEMADRDNKNI